MIKQTLVSFALLATVPFLTTPSTYAQTAMAIPGSGSGNGSINRDLLDYETKVNDSIESLQSVEESFQQLIKDIKAMSAAEVPTYQGVSEDFWTQMTEEDRQTILKFDERYLNGVKAAIESINELRLSVVSEKAFIDTFAKEGAYYVTHGLEKRFKSEIKHRTRGLEIKLRNGLFNVLRELINVTIVNGPGIRQSTITTSDVVNACQTVACVEIVAKKTIQMTQTSIKVGDVEVHMLGFESTLKKIYDFRIGIWNSSYGLESKALKLKGLKRAVSETMQILTTDKILKLHEAKIRANNN